MRTTRSPNAATGDHSNDRESIRTSDINYGCIGTLPTAGHASHSNVGNSFDVPSIADGTRECTHYAPGRHLIILEMHDSSAPSLNHGV
jgi:hypothetical protein